MYPPDPTRPDLSDPPTKRSSSPPRRHSASTPLPTTLNPLASIWRHRRLALVAMALPIMLAAASIVFLPRRYSSEAKLFLRIGRESVSVDPTASSVGEPMSMQLTRETEILSVVDMMQSRDVFENVVDDVGVESILEGRTIEAGSDAEKSNPIVSVIRWPVDRLRGAVGSLDPIPQRERALMELSNTLGIYNERNSTIVTVSYRAKSPEFAQTVLVSWIEHFRRRHAELHNNRDGVDFLQAQQGELAEQLSEARTKLQRFKNESGLVTIGGGQGMIEAERSELRRELDATTAQIAAADKRIEKLNALIEDEVDSTIRSAVTAKEAMSSSDMRSKLFDLEVQYQDMSSKLSPGHPKLVAIERQLRQTQQIVRNESPDMNEITEAINPSYQRLIEKQLADIAERSGLIEKERTIIGRLKSLGEEIRRLNVNENEAARLTQAVEILQRQFDLQSDRYAMAKRNDLLADAGVTSIQVAQRPDLRHRPVSPKKPIVAALGVLAAMGLAIGLPVLLDRRELFAGWLQIQKRVDAGDSAKPSESLDNRDLENRSGLARDQEVAGRLEPDQRPDSTESSESAEPSESAKEPSRELEVASPIATVIPADASDAVVATPMTQVVAQVVGVEPDDGGYRPESPR